jgi:phage repressor protein C with HTH and peptisase S24 domain
MKRAKPARSKSRRTKRRAAQQHKAPVEPPKLVDPPPRRFGQDGLARCYMLADHMAPRFDVGELLIVEKKRPARIGDDVLVDIRGATAGYSRVARLVERTRTGLRLKQFNPPYEFDLEADRVVEVYRIMTTEDLLGPT